MGALNGNGYVRGSQWVRGKCGLKDRSPGLLLCFPTSCCCLFSQQMVLSTCCARLGARMVKMDMALPSRSI